MVRGRARTGIVAFSFLALWLSFSCSPGKKSQASGPAGKSAGEGGDGILALLGIEPSAESVDYVRNKTQFQLHTLLTEQRHPKTYDLSERIQKDTLAGLRMLSSVDDDIRTRLDALASNTESLDGAAAAMEEALLAGRKIYIYGCGATGRLAKQMESSFWRPFWRRVAADGGLRARLAGRLPASIGDRLIGEMTGADRALISSLEGFEDLLLIGRLQLEDHGVSKGDVVVCVTEGGETSSVIGTILAAHDQWKAAPGYSPELSRKNLYFIYNNPDDRLMPFERSRKVLEEPGITKINLTTGPQAITGSTRMQATTIETYVVATVLEAVAARVLGGGLSPAETAGLGFAGRFDIGEKLRGFAAVLEGARAALPSLARLTDLEAGTYGRGRFSTYFAKDGLITVFIDSTERSPTFRLYPLDTVKEPRRKCWIQVWTAAETPKDAWLAFLGRPFRGLDPEFYRRPFEERIDDPYLRRAALESLKKAGDEQQDLYDFSFSDFNLKNRGPEAGDLGVMVGLNGEEDAIVREGGYFRRFMDLFAGEGMSLAVLAVTDETPGAGAGIEGAIGRPFKGRTESLLVVPIAVPCAGDPFRLNARIAAKMLLNAHSTAVMAKLGKVIGNTMTNVSPSNLKLIGRATYLIQLHVNDVLARPEWIASYGRREPLSYAEANAVLFDAIDFLKDRQAEAGQTAEVAYSIIRILESARRGRGIGREEALGIVKGAGLAAYLSGF
jgi:N-acetylmuramic acid 6-phosphate etherase